jgi:hypothetical protein
MTGSTVCLLYVSVNAIDVTFVFRDNPEVLMAFIPFYNPSAGNDQWFSLPCCSADPMYD